MTKFNPCPKPIKSEKKKVYVLKRTPLKKKPYKIKPRSDKRAAQEKVYKVVRLVYLENHHTCEYNYEGCTKIATDIDHTKGRIGELLTNIKFFKACCRSCHDIRHIENIKI